MTPDMKCPQKILKNRPNNKSYATKNLFTRCKAGIFLRKSINTQLHPVTEKNFGKPKQYVILQESPTATTQVNTIAIDVRVYILCEI
jgi:hypothetical protein